MDTSKKQRLNMRAVYANFKKMMHDRFFELYDKCDIYDVDSNNILIAFIWAPPEIKTDLTHYYFELRDNDVFSCGDYIINLFNEEFGLHPFETLGYVLAMLKTKIGEEEYTRLTNRLGLNCNT